MTEQVKTAISTLKPVSNAPVVSKELGSLLDGSGTGFENLRPQDVLIPRLTILQGLSPQVIPSKSQYDKEARVGEIYDTGLGERFKSVHILPLHFKTQWLEWGSRTSGKGLISISDSPPKSGTFSLSDKGQMITPEGNLIVETAQIYCLNLSAGGRPSFIAFSSTQLKKARKLMTLATNERVVANGKEVVPPLFYRSYILSSGPESNASGDWMGWTITPDKRVDELENWQARLAVVKDFRSNIIQGNIKVDLEQHDHDNVSNDKKVM